MRFALPTMMRRPSQAVSSPSGRVTFLTAAALATAVLVATVPRPTSAAKATRQEVERIPRGVPTAPSNAPLQLATAVHVHTRATASGRLSVVELAELARREGVDAIVFADNLVREYRYGPWFLRSFFEVRRTAPALVDFGIETFLQELATARERFPGLLMLAGVEVTPYYWWSGSLLQRRLVLHDFQRDLIVLPGPGSPEESAELISRLPVIGNPGAQNWGLGSLVELVPGLALVALGIRKLHAGRRASPDGGHRLGRSSGVVALVVGVALLTHHYPFTEPLYRPYDPELGRWAEQRLIDHVRQRGGLVLWSTPEVDNSGGTSVGPVRVEFDSPPYVEGLSRSRNWNAFGGLYAHGIEAIEPGGAWDRLLLEHVRGERLATPWMMGESDFRYTGQAGKFLSEILTVLMVNEPAAGSALAALGGGHSYAVRQTEDDGLRLAEFSVSTDADAGRAWPGQRLNVPAGTRLRIRVAVESRTSGPLACRVRLVRNGEVVEEWEATTPFARRIVDDHDGIDTPLYYRVDVEGPRPHRLATNPVLVGR